jgi:integrase
LPRRRLDNARLVVRQAITTVDHEPSLGNVRDASRLRHPDVMTRAFARLVKRSGLPRIRLHDLRDTHATHLLAAGTNVRVTSERLGHASVAFTLDVYGHVLPGQQADAAAAVSALVDR